MGSVRKHIAVVAVLSLPLAPVGAYYLAPDHGYLIEVGAHHTSETWSTGIKHDSTGIYALLGHGLHERLMVYWKVFADNPVINGGVANPNDETERADISPNTFIYGFGLGMRGIPWKNDRWAVMGTLDYQSLSEFDDFVEWSNGVYSDIHVDEISTYSAAMFLIRDLGRVHAYLGGNISSTYAHGEVLNMAAGEPNNFAEIDERDKIAVKAVLGARYAVGENWTMYVHAETGDGFAGMSGFSRTF